MPDLIAKRTLVKSPPELWEELSEVERLAKHLGAFGEIKITKLEPEHTVAWEGEHASGTVSIEPSGWGTKVTLQAELPEAEEPEAELPEAEVPQPEPEVPDPQPAPHEPGPVEPPPAAVVPEPVTPAPAPELEPTAGIEEAAPNRRRGFWAWLFRPRRAEAEIVTEPEPAAVAPEEISAVCEPILPPEPENSEPTVEVAEPEAVEPEAEAAAEEGDEEADEPAGLDAERARAILDEALDALGAAHHRPFSRG
jgi:hypothetical protein